MIIIFGRLRAAGLKVNVPKCSFGLKEITYLGYDTTREGIKPDARKVKGIIFIGRPATTTEARALIGMVHYYRDMWPRRSHILAPLTEAASRPKGRNIYCNYVLENSFKEIKRMVSAKKLMSDPDWKMPFTVHTYVSDKQLGAVIIKNDKPITFFSIIFSKTRRNYTTTDKELLGIVECLKLFRIIIFGYEKNVLSYNKNLVYAATLS